MSKCARLSNDHCSLETRLEERSSLEMNRRDPRPSSSSSSVLRKTLAKALVFFKSIALIFQTFL